MDVDGTVAVSWPDSGVEEGDMAELLGMVDDKDSEVNDGVAVPTLVAVDDLKDELNESDGEEDVVINVKGVIEDMIDITYELVRVAADY